MDYGACMDRISDMQLHLCHGLLNEFVAEDDPIDLARNIHAAGALQRIQCYAGRLQGKPSLALPSFPAIMLAGTFLYRPPTPPRKSSAMRESATASGEGPSPTHEPSPSLARISFGLLHLTLESHTALELPVHCTSWLLYNRQG